jgi:hypothetical protein
LQESSFCGERTFSVSFFAERSGSVAQRGNKKREKSKNLIFIANPRYELNLKKIFLIVKQGKKVTGAPVKKGCQRNLEMSPLFH